MSEPKPSAPWYLRLKANPEKYAAFLAASRDRKRAARIADPEAVRRVARAKRAAAMADPVKREAYKARRREKLQALKETDPTRLAAFRAKAAAKRRRAQAREKADPERWAKRLAYIREWRAKSPEYRARELARRRKNPINPKIQVNS
jgi:hypothetical protein